MTPKFKSKYPYGAFSNDVDTIESIVHAEVRRSFDSYGGGGAMERTATELDKLRDIVAHMAAVMTPQQQVELADRLGYNEV